MKPIKTRDHVEGAVPGSFFLHEAETTKAPRVEPCVKVVKRHPMVVNHEEMRLIMHRHGEEPLLRVMCRSWHEGC
jgi:hypothetical protein